MIHGGAFLGPSVNTRAAEANPSKLMAERKEERQTERRNEIGTRRERGTESAVSVARAVSVCCRASCRSCAVRSVIVCRWSPPEAEVVRLEEPLVFLVHSLPLTHCVSVFCVLVCASAREIECGG